MIKKIIVLRGLQGSEKTIWAKQWVNEDPEHKVRFNRNDIRNMLGKYWVPSRENLINDIYFDFLRSAVDKAYDIVIDNMNLNEKCINELEDFVLDTNRWYKQSPLAIEYKLEIKDFFHVPLQTCIDRDAKREHPIGENVIRNTFNKYKDKIIPWKYLS